MSRNSVPDSGKVVRLHASRERGGGPPGGRGHWLLLGAVLVGLMAGYYWWSSSQRAASIADAPVTIDTQTADVIEDADVEWEQRASDGAAPVAEAGRVTFGFCHGGRGANCVVDGDTFHLNGERVRIAGIDAPETYQSNCAAEIRLGNPAAAPIAQ